jgi:hypothetical protein
MIDFVLPSVTFILGLFAGFVLNKILPIEYKFYRQNQREDENEVDQWYKETLPIINKLAINSLQLWLKQNPEEADHPFGVRLEEYDDTDVYRDIRELTDEFQDQLYGAPKDLEISFGTISGVSPQLASVLRAVKDPESGITTKWLYDIMRVAVEINEHAAKRTGRYTSELVNQELVEWIDSELPDPEKVKY